MSAKNFRNVEVFEGDVFETLPKYLENHPATRISLLHLDLDVFAPTKYALELLWERVVKNGIVIFDDYGTVEGETVVVDKFLDNHDLKLIKGPYGAVPSYVIKP